MRFAVFVFTVLALAWGLWLSSYAIVPEAVLGSAVFFLAGVGVGIMLRH